MGLFVERAGIAQVLQWAFAGAPGHPALREVCDRIAAAAGAGAGAGAAAARTPDGGALERAGAGVWTEVVLKHARLHAPAQARRVVACADCFALGVARQARTCVTCELRIMSRSRQLVGCMVSLSLPTAYYLSWCAHVAGARVANAVSGRRNCCAGG